MMEASALLARARGFKDVVAVVEQAIATQHGGL
jgi:hypothetical protein